ncbi:MAG: heparan-alpha-glucosaminide N-acetyltransferase domain-containing protein [Gammaproteobacteria bacterium]
MSYITPYRIPFIDALRGVALLLMVANHTALYLLDASLDPGRHYLVYLTVSLSAPLFLFLVGFSLSLSYYRTDSAPAKFSLSHYWRYMKRGLWLLLTGYGLNIILRGHEPFYAGGILQTIGISIILFTPLLPWLRRPLFSDALVFAALLLYLVFVTVQPGLPDWNERHPLMAQLFFNGFPPWPWTSLVLVGLVMGYKWIEAEQQPTGVRPYIGRTSITGWVCVAIYFAINVAQGNLINFNIGRDYLINGHWLPSSTTMFWIIGMLLLCFAAVYRCFENRYRYLDGLIVLGQSAFVLYVVHLLIIIGIAHRGFELRINHWWLFVGFNLLLVGALLIAAGRYRALSAQYVLRQDKKTG